MKSYALLSLALCLNQSAFAQATSGAIYDVIKIDQAVKIDGDLNEAVWASVPAIDGSFHFPWETQRAPRTIFRAYHDGEQLYFAFDVQDKDVVLVKTDVQDDEKVVDAEDRVELFFAPTAIDQPNENGMPNYYAIEIDALARVHDYAITYYRHFDSNWQLPHLEKAATTSENGYRVEGKIALATLRELGVLHQDMMRTGVFRAEFSKQKDRDEPLMQWISWVNPRTAHPDFHVEAAFGQWRLLEK